MVYVMKYTRHIYCTHTYTCICMCMCIYIYIFWHPCVHVILHTLRYTCSLLYLFRHIIYIIYAIHVMSCHVIYVIQYVICVVSHVLDHVTHLVLFAFFMEFVICHIINIICHVINVMSYISYVGSCHVLRLHSCHFGPRGKKVVSQNSGRFLAAQISHAKPGNETTAFIDMLR